MVSGSDQRDQRPAFDDGGDASIGATLDLITTYAKQETIEPIKGAGRFIAFGTAAAVALGIGGLLVLLGLLRLLQTEVERTASGSLSWLSYLIVLVVAAAAIGLAVSRINKSASNGEGR